MCFTQKRKLLFTATAKHNLAYLDGITHVEQQLHDTALLALSKPLSLELWHR
jgi:hypothetical protein